MPARLLRALCAIAVLLAAVPAAAGAASAPAHQSHVLRADVQIHRFVVTKAGLRALGTASADLGGSDARKTVTMAVTRGPSCSILTLDLQQLNLQLLGLDLTTSAINLRITGQSNQTLGALFCRLATALKLAHNARAAAASLNRAIRHHPLHAIRVRSRLRVATAQAAQAPAPSCKVLDLVLGPLNLNLLGLVVDLYGPTRTTPVEVHVTADPAGGVLGAVFCKLATSSG